MPEEKKPIAARVPRLSAGLFALAALAVAFTVVFPNFFAPQGAPPPASQVLTGTYAQAVQADPLERFRLEREQVRKVEVAQLNALIADDGADKDLRDGARRQLLNLTAHMEQEVTLEGVLTARGFEGALATVHSDSVNVLVKAASLTRAESAAILELTLRETGQKGENIKIIPVE